MSAYRHKSLSLHLQNFMIKGNQFSYPFKMLKYLKMLPHFQFCVEISF